ncbi:Polyketide synthase modules-related protein [Tenacibaculum discolor]
MNIEDVYPLSPLQEGIYYHWLSSPSAYFEQMSYRMKGKVDFKALEESYEKLVSRYAILRTFFTNKIGGKLLQVVKKEVSSTFFHIKANEQVDFSIKQFKKEDREKGFDLHSGSQMRLIIIDLGNEEYEFIWSMNHILMDGWCIGILIQDFFKIYNSITKGNELILKKVPPYSDYIKWLMNKDQKVSIEYWRDHLFGYDTVACLPEKKIINDEIGGVKIEKLIIEGKQRELIKNICKKEATTENIFLQTIWGILLGKYNNTNDVVFGSVVSGRPTEISGVEEMIGLFINTIPVRISFDKDMEVKKLLKQVQSTFIKGTDHHYVQLGEIQSNTSLGRGLFNHVVIFENFPTMEADALFQEDGEGLALLSSDVYERTNYDFTLVIVPGEKIIIRFEYDTSKYSSSSINNLKNHFNQCINQVCNNHEVCVKDVNYLTKEEEESIVNDFNINELIFDENETLVSLFESRVNKSLEEIAVVFEDREITYKTLEEKSNQFAHYLKDNYGIGKGDTVVVKLDKTEWVVIALMGILKTGGVYVPVDINYPNQRVQFIIEDSNCKVVIDEEIIEDFKHKIFPKNNNLDVVISKDDLAYIIYTSGTTGKPKGVMVEHKNIVSFIESCNKEFNLEKLKLPLLSSNAFDISLFELFYPLATGGTVTVLSNRYIKDINYVIKCLRNVNAFHAVPALMGQILNYIKSTNAGHKFQGINNLFIGGDAVSTNILKEMREIFPKATLHELYGPTESTIFVTSHHYDSTSKNDEYNGALIGNPNPNSSIYILDENNQACGFGIIGEICVGGCGVTRGYLNQEVLTKEKFVVNPFNLSERIYKTGDLGKWNNDGTIEIIGRRDNQVKIRGYRIELKEIEENILNINNIVSAFITTTPDKNDEKELIAYIVSSEKINVEKIKEELNKVLPNYMIPNYFLQLDKIPLTTNNKVDRKKLPIPNELNFMSRATYVEPSTITEEKLVSIWKEILGINERIGIKDNFFNLGGHSIKATRLITEIYKHFKIELNISVLFETSTLEELSKEIDNIIWVNTSEDFSDVETEDIII